MKKLSGLLAILLSLESHAALVTETFNSRSTLNSSTAVWNQELGVVHSIPQIEDYGPGWTAIPYDIGDGSHGAFIESRYAEFGGDANTKIIHLDTTLYPELKVTTFFLAKDWVLEPIGDNPLIIRSQSDVIIEGTILCSGDDGENAVGATPGQGGQGRCGGTDGGNGGAVGGNATNGGDIDINVTGGMGGNFTGGAAVGGGGGGSWNTPPVPTNGPAANAFGGLAGTSVADPTFLTIAGGAGGGGGSGTPAAAGAGGGAGGGVVLIYAGRDVDLGRSPGSTFGWILANGGVGGSSNVAGGPGGGAGGGSVQVFVARTLNIYNSDGAGAGQANNGIGGTNSLMVLGAVGGRGRNWYSSTFFTNPTFGYYTPPEDLPSFGYSRYTGAMQEITTKTIDLGSSRPTFNSITTSPVHADFVVEAAGSDDAFASDDTGWQSNMAILAGKRYVRFRVQINTTDLVNGRMLDSVTLDYTPWIREDFNLQAGCGRVTSPAEPTDAWPLLLLICVLLGLKFKTKKNKSVAEN